MHRKLTSWVVTANYAPRLSSCTLKLKSSLSILLQRSEAATSLPFWADRPNADAALHQIDILYILLTHDSFESSIVIHFFQFFFQSDDSVKLKSKYFGVDHTNQLNWEKIPGEYDDNGDGFYSIEVPYKWNPIWSLEEIEFEQ